MDKFRNKLPKEDLKKFAKEIGKKLVASDFKHNRVEDPTKITDKQEKKVRKYVKEFFDKAVAKKAAHDKLKGNKNQDSATNGNDKETPNGTSSTIVEADADSSLKIEEPDDVDLSDDEEETGQAVASVPVTPSLDTPSDEGLKRKREDLGDSFDSTPSETPIKRIKEEDMEGLPSPPPPPPPPPTEDMVMQIDEDAELAAQEEALMRENEEALMRENEEALHDAELHKGDIRAPLAGSIDNVDTKASAVKTDEDDNMDQDFTMKEVNGNAIVKMESTANDSEESVGDLSDVEENRNNRITQHERKEVLSH
jgi:[histone H3]-lysine36 N-trimethyltransferase